MKKVTAYEAEDGRLFKSEQDCGHYELYGKVDAFSMPGVYITERILIVSRRSTVNILRA